LERHLNLTLYATAESLLELLRQIRNTAQLVQSYRGIQYYDETKISISSANEKALQTMKMNEIEIDNGFEVEASPTFFSSSSGGALVEEDEDDTEQLHQQDDESTMNDESVDNETSYATAGYSYITSNIKWFVIAMASFAVFFGIGIGLGYGPIGNSIYGNDDASSVSSAMAVDFTASDHGGKSDGGAKSGKSKSDKSSGVSCVEYVHRFWAYDMNQPPFRCNDH